MRLFCGRLRSDDRGATAIEYGLIAALIVVAMSAGLAVLAGATVNKMDYVASEVSKT